MSSFGTEKYAMGIGSRRPPIVKDPMSIGVWSVMKTEFPKALVMDNILALGDEPFMWGSNNPGGPMVRHKRGP